MSAIVNDFLQMDFLCLTLGIMLKHFFLTLKFVVDGSFLLHVILLFFLNFFCVFGFIGDYKVRNPCENGC